MLEAIIAILSEPALTIGFVIGLFLGWLVCIIIWGYPNIKVISAFGALGAAIGVILFGKSVWPKK